MKNKNSIQEKILNQPSYWVEGFNSFLYNAILDYMEDNNMNRTQLASHLGISKGRVSQILNDGEINFSIEKIVQIALKIDKFPIFEFKDKVTYLNELNSIRQKANFTSNYQIDSFSNIQIDKKAKIIPLHINNEFQKRITL